MYVHVHLHVGTNNIYTSDYGAVFSQIRAACYTVVGTLCRHGGDFIASHARQFCTLVLCGLGERDPGVVGALWETALLIINLIQVRAIYSGTSLIRTPLGQKKVSLLVRCPDFRVCNVHKQGVWDSQMCPVYRDVLISGCSE